LFVLARVVDMTRSGAGDTEIIETARKQVGRREFGFSEADARWLLAQRVSPQVVNSLYQLAGRRRQEYPEPQAGGEPLLTWHEVLEDWLDERPWAHGGLPSRCQLPASEEVR
jgi:hypothetical protein